MQVKLLHSIAYKLEAPLHSPRLQLKHCFVPIACQFMPANCGAGTRSLLLNASIFHSPMPA